MEHKNIDLQDGDKAKKGVLTVLYIYIYNDPKIWQQRVTSVCQSTCPHVKIPLISESMHRYWAAGLSN